MWGLLFIVVGVCVLLLHRIAGHSAVEIILYSVGPALYVMWAVMFLISGLRSAEASFAGVPIYLYLAYRHSLSGD
jgi:hypothetical protein